ncbi:MAG TPA: hypothetical protein VFN77_12020 [Acetobacteraceae bacterium]|nr:hypothetical protein [Acetobacteraceae bacterium]
MSEKSGFEKLERRGVAPPAGIVMPSEAPEAARAGLPVILIPMLGFMLALMLIVSFSIALGGAAGGMRGSSNGGRSQTRLVTFAF